MVHIHVCIHVHTGYMFDCWYMYSTLILRCNLESLISGPAKPVYNPAEFDLIP